MKNLKFLTLLSAFLLFCYSCEDKNLKDDSNNTKAPKKVKTDDPPTTNEELNRDVYFTLNLKNEKSYQPMHFESCPNASFIILGQFINKDNNGGHKLDKINFSLFNSHFGDTLSIKEVKLSETKTKGVINLDVIIVKSTGKEPNPFVFNASKIKRIKKKTIIDLHLKTDEINDEGNNREYPQCSSTRPDMVNIGDHICKSVIPDPNS